MYCENCKKHVVATTTPVATFNVLTTKRGKGTIKGKTRKSFRFIEICPDCGKEIVQLDLLAHIAKQKATKVDA